ncbi:MAG TPA: cation:proton antiporter [Candidatus Limnocylindrales bacterium]|nr:cation:proton antiporter [Candidatus Limnocylindrales bacterium]
MNETLAFILDVGVATAAALIGGTIARRLGQPPLVGYLLAGIAIGPFTPGFVGDVERIAVLAEVGVVLLVFALGVEFSLRELYAVRKVALGAALAQIGITVVAGAGLALVVGLEARPALILGAVLAISSTLVVAKMLEERGELDSLHGKNAIGWMIVQDVATIVFIVVLPAIATDELSVTPLLLALGKGALFLLIAFVVGTRLLPLLFAAVARLGSPELFLLAVVSTALLTAFVSSAVFGLSLALGAFVAGVLVSESDLAHQAAAEVIPFRDLFAVLFFVSIGMLVDPTTLLAQAPLIAILTIVAVAGKGLLSAALGRAFGLPWRSALLLGAAIAQVGEFSLIIAADASDLGLIDGTVYNAILATTIVSIFLSAPARIVAEAAVTRIERRETERWSARRAAGEEGPTGAAPAGAGGGPPDSPSQVRRRIVVAGSGRVGRIVTRAVRARSYSCLVIDRDRRRLDEAVALGAETLYGDAARPEILALAGLDHAVVLVIAIGDPLTARLVAERARRLNPLLMVASRARGTRQARDLRGAGVNRLADPDNEAAIELARHALQRMGISSQELTAITTGLRRDAYR